MREYTNKIVDLVDEGFYGDLNESTKILITGLLTWLSEDDVEKFWFANGYGDLYEENEDAE